MPSTRPSLKPEPTVGIRNLLLDCSRTETSTRTTLTSFIDTPSVAIADWVNDVIGEFTAAVDVLTDILDTDVPWSDSSLHQG